MLKKAVLQVEGMSCNHCVNSIQKAVGVLAGVSRVEVNLGAKTVSVEFAEDEVSLDKIKETIDDQGYDVK